MVECYERVCRFIHEVKHFATKVEKTRQNQEIKEKKCLINTNKALKISCNFLIVNALYIVVPLGLEPRTP